MQEACGRTAITGVGGVVGFHLADHLCRTDPAREIVGISRSPNTNVEALRVHPNFRFVAADVVQSPDLREALAGAQVLYHLAAQSAIYRARQDPLGDLRTNVQGTLAALLAAAAVGVRKVIFTSGGAVYPSQAYAREESVGQPPSFYGASKLAAETYVRVVGATHGLRYTILRLSRVYGPRMARGAVHDLIQDFQARRPANMYAHPDSLFDFVFVEDVVSALARAAGERWDGTTANVSSGRGTRLRDLHAAFVALLGYSVPLQPVEGVPLVHVLVNERARSLGWEPRYSMADGLLETLQHFLPGGFDPSAPIAEILGGDGTPPGRSFDG